MGYKNTLKNMKTYHLCKCENYQNNDNCCGNTQQQKKILSFKRLGF